MKAEAVERANCKPKSDGDAGGAADPSEAAAVRVVDGAEGSVTPIFDNALVTDSFLA